MDIKDYKKLIEKKENKRAPKKKNSQPEKKIENEILDYLDKKGYYAIKHNRVGVYDAKKKVYRKPKNKYQRVGIADIQFFTNVIIKENSSAFGTYLDDNGNTQMNYRTYPANLTIFLEVKTKTGKQSKDQKDFQARVENAGCIYRVVRSIDDVIKLLDELK